MYRFIICFLLALILIQGSTALSDEKKSDRVTVSGRWQLIKTIEKFAIVHLETVGSAEGIGLRQDEFQDYLRLRFKNSFAGMDFKPDDALIDEAMFNFEKARKNGTILVSVWTIGGGNQVTYHIKLNGGSLVDRQLYNKEVLGYDSKKNIPYIVRNTISDFIDEFAIFFFKNRDEL